jgi:uncharacterized repeat protein (TIGR03806 family)
VIFGHTSHPFVLSVSKHCSFFFRRAKKESSPSTSSERTGVGAVLLALALASCVRAPAEVTFHADGYPETLSEWGLFAVEPGRIAPRPGLVTYDLATPLFSDYAQKWRAVWMPKGAAARYDPKQAFDFPVGTIVAKTFYYPTPAGAAPQTSTEVLKPTTATYQSGVEGLDTRQARIIETRLLVRRAAGWVAIPYVWDADGRDARLARTGADVALTLVDGAERQAFGYAVPNQNQCAGCHATDARTRALHPIGLKARHVGPALARLTKAGYVTGAPASGAPRIAVWTDERAPIEARARSYLDINCSHCHSATGPARTSGLWLDPDAREPHQIGLCKPPVAAGRGTGDRPFGVVPGHPEQSILAYRLASTDPGAMMPELGRALAHREGVALVARYIAGMKGTCERSGG